MAKEFYNDLINYVSKSDTNNAHALLMKEVGKSLVKDKSNFVELLTSSGIPASESMSDVELVDLFVGNLPNNKSLMIGTSYMINNSNKFIGADGTEQISDKGVKVCYRVMYDFFSCDDSNADEFVNANGQRYSNLAADPVSAIAQGVGALANLGSAGISASQKKKYGATDLLSKQAESRSQLLQSILAQKQAEVQAKQKAAESKSKTQKILLIGGIVVVTLILGYVVIKKVRQ